MRRREAAHLVHHRAQIAVQAAQELRVVQRREADSARKHAADDRISLLRAAHRFHHVAEVRGMQVAEEAHEAPVGPRCSSTCGLLRLGGDGARASPARRSRRRPGSTCRRARGSRLLRARARCWAACRRRSAPSARAARLLRRCELVTALAWPYLSTSMRVGVRPSAKVMPSSSAFSTSSWLRV